MLLFIHHASKASATAIFFDSIRLKDTLWSGHFHSNSIRDNFLQKIHGFHQFSYVVFIHRIMNLQDFQKSFWNDMTNSELRQIEIVDPIASKWIAHPPMAALMV